MLAILGATETSMIAANSTFVGRRVLVLTFCSILAFAAAVLLTRALDSTGQRQFDKREWSRGVRETRTAMVKDVLKNHLSTTMDLEDVVDLFGSPDEILRHQDAGGNRLQGDKTLSYCLTSGNSLEYDDMFLYVHIGPLGNVVHYEINGY